MNVKTLIINSRMNGKPVSVQSLSMLLPQIMRI